MSKPKPKDKPEDKEELLPSGGVEESKGGADAKGGADDVVGSLEKLLSALSAGSVAKIYDKRFDPEEETYSARFSARTPLGEVRVIDRVVAKSTPAISADKKKWNENAKKEYERDEAKFFEVVKPHRVSIFDFGCGDGRTLPLFQKFAEGLSHQGSTLRIKAYDISVEGINAYKRRLGAAGFKLMDEGALAAIYADPELTHLRQHGVFRKDNLEVELLSGVPETTHEQLGTDVGQVDITTVLFGSLSHVFPAKSRDAFLGMMIGITKNHIAMTVPGKALFLENQQSTKLFEAVLELGDGEMFYHPEGLPDKFLLPYALYDARSLRGHLDRAGASETDISISAFKFRPPVASKHRSVDILDNAAALALSKLMKSFPRVAAALPDKVTRAVYYGVVAKGGAMHSGDTVDAAEVRRPGGSVGGAAATAADIERRSKWGCSRRKKISHVRISTAFFAMSFRQNPSFQSIKLTAS